MAVNKSSARRGLAKPKNTKGKEKATVGTYKSKLNSPAGSRPKMQAKGKGRAVHNEASDIPASSSLPPLSVNAANHTRETAPDHSSKVVKDTQAKQRDGEGAKKYVLYVGHIYEEIVWHTGGEVAQGSMDYFFEHILPPINPGFNIDQIFERCVENKALVKSRLTNSYSWKCFPSRTNRRNGSKSILKGSHIVKLFDSITKAAMEKDVAPPNLKTTCSAYTGKSEDIWSMRDSRFHPDVHLFLNSPGDSYPKKYNGKHWYNSAFSLFFVKDLDSVYNEFHNVDQILYSMHHCMAIDPCRRFALGATIEGRQMRLWHYNRGIVICSKEFDIDSEPRTMIKVVLSLVFADKADLGWDPTVVAEYDGKQRLFEFEVDGRYYKSSTENIIAESRADDVYTSATRIFKAFTVDDQEEKNPVVIKDYWPPDDFETEDVIWQKILEDIRDEEERELFKRMTLTPIVSGRVRVGDGEDHTEKTILRGKGPISRHIIRLPDGSNARDDSSSSDSEEEDERAPVPSRKLKDRRIYVHRWHYRIVYQEYAVPYNKLRNLDDMLLVLECAVKVLRVIHKAGWVHRDLSAGNLYLYTDPVTGEKRGLVGDLELAKRAGSGKDGDVRAGTPDFMASEILNQVYMFGFDEESPIECWSEELRRVHAELEEDMLASGKGESETSSDAYKFWANYIHDLESMWWVMAWTLFKFQEASLVASGSKEYKKMRDKQKCTGLLLFNGGIRNGPRHAFLTIRYRFGQLMRTAPVSLMELKTIIVTIRELLVEHYKREESRRVSPILLTDGGSLHDGILAALNEAPRRNIEVETIERQRRREAGEVRVSKRKTYETRDDIKQPEKRLKPVQELNKADSDSSNGSSGQAVAKESKTSSDRMVLRSALRNRQNKSNRGAGGHNRNSVSGGNRPTKGLIPVIILPPLQCITRKPRVIAEEKPLTSAVKSRQKKMNIKNNNQDRKTSDRTRRPREKVPVLAENRRITRSMTRMKLAGLVTAANTQASGLKSRVASTKSRKRR